MYQAPLPQEYVDLSPEETRNRIIAAKQKLGSELLILGHHYQRDEIIEHADFRGDSYKLAQEAAKRPHARFIVFCGVHFMAESADLLTQDDQTVILPNLSAGCSMADMANAFQVKSCWRELSSILGNIEGRVVPVTYINSAANLKAFVGEHGGTVCTSSNATIAVEWALKRGDKILFFPDQHLGRNTGVKLGFDPNGDMCVWDPSQPLGGNSPDKLKQSRFILWKGHCSVHQRFTVAQIEEARRRFPDVQVIVHPECTLDVVKAADHAGSTEFILKTVSEAAPGTTWAVGTEINLVSRMAKEMPNKTIVCLDPEVCPCSTMYRIHPSFLLWSLENIVDGNPTNQIKVPEKVASQARKALEQMLRLQ